MLKSGHKKNVDLTASSLLSLGIIGMSSILLSLKCRLHRLHESKRTLALRVRFHSAIIKQVCYCSRLIADFFMYV